MLQKYADVRTAVHIPTQGSLSADREIYVYNPSVELWYSLDGGDHYKQAEGNIIPAEFHNPDLKYIPSSYHWQLPVGDFPECHTIQVKIAQPERSIVSEPVTVSYLEESHADLPVICISAAQKDLVSEAKGLFVFGESSYEDEGFYKNWWNRSANFQKRGSAWEKEVTIQLFEKGIWQMEQRCGLKISGNATRGFPQKSMQLVARLNYGEDKFSFPMLGEDGLKKYTSLVLRNSGNDNSKTMFADLLMQRLASKTNVLTQTGRPAVVYINGNYWGIYNIQERIDPYMIAKKEDVKEEEVTILEGSGAELKDGEENIKAAFDELMNEVRNAPDGDKKTYKKVADQMDLNSFMDYIFFETYYANSDWPANNSMWYKAGDKKWKWILNDLDYGMAYLGEQQVQVNLFDKLKKSESVVSNLFNFLVTVTDFSDAFKKRAEELLENDLSETTITKEFEHTQNQYRSEIERHIRRWRMIDSLKAWEQNCEANLTFLKQRKEIYKSQLNALP